MIAGSFGPYLALSARDHGGGLACGHSPEQMGLVCFSGHSSHMDGMVASPRSYLRRWLRLRGRSGIPWILCGVAGLYVARLGPAGAELLHKLGRLGLGDLDELVG